MFIVFCNLVSSGLNVAVVKGLINSFSRIEPAKQVVGPLHLT